MYSLAAYGSQAVRQAFSFCSAGWHVVVLCIDAAVALDDSHQLGAQAMAHVSSDLISRNPRMAAFEMLSHDGISTPLFNEIHLRYML